jgi:hypothetical protein
MTFGTSGLRARHAQYVHSLPDRRLSAQATKEPSMIYVLLLACLWSAVGASVFFVRADISLRQRLALTIATSVVFGAVGWLDVSSIYDAVRSGPAVIAKEAVRPTL